MSSGIVFTVYLAKGDLAKISTKKTYHRGKSFFSILDYFFFPAFAFLEAAFTTLLLLDFLVSSFFEAGLVTSNTFGDSAGTKVFKILSSLAFRVSNCCLN